MKQNNSGFFYLDFLLQRKTTVLATALASKEQSSYVHGSYGINRSDNSGN